MRAPRARDVGGLLDCLAAGYRLDLDEAAYLTHLVEVASPLLDRGLGVLAYTYDATNLDRPVIDRVVTSGPFESRWLPTFYAAVEAAGHRGPPHPTGFETWRHMTSGQASAVPRMRPFLPFFAHIGGARDALAINALDAGDRGLWLGAPMTSTRRVPEAQIALFARLASHLATAMRIRRNARAARPTAAAILAPGGELLHAASEETVTAREDLRRATVAFDEARTKRARADVDLATRRWRPVVAARWSLLDDFDSDGRRFVVAVENAPPTRPARHDLSPREHHVMTQAHLGHTDKIIAYELGLTASTVRVLLHRASKKLGASTRREALARFDRLVRERAGTPS